MSRALSIRLTRELADWLATAAAETGVSQSQIVRDLLEQARTAKPNQAFVRLAAAVRGPRDLSARKGFTQN